MKRDDTDYGPAGRRDGIADRHRPLANEQNGEERGARKAEEVDREFEFAASFHVRSNTMIVNMVIVNTIHLDRN